MATWESYLQENSAQFLEQLLEFLRIPSISSQPEHKNDVQRAAEWVSVRLRKAGIEDVQILSTGGHPVVYGQWMHANDKPTILIYGHFDIQPVDPIELWSAPPFEPVVVSRVCAVRWSVMVTVAPASGPPLASVTLPSMPEVICCAATGVATVAAAVSETTLAARRYLIFMRGSP